MILLPPHSTLFPYTTLFRSRVGHRRHDQPEVTPPAAIRADVEQVTTVIDLVLVLVLSRGEHGPHAAEVPRRDVARLGGGVARRVQEEVREAPRARDAEPEQLVGLLVEEIVPGGAQSVAPEPVRALGVVLG